MPVRDTPKARKRAPRVKRSADLRILVATAGDADSVGALHMAGELAQRKRASVLALAVTMPFPHNVSTLISPTPPATIDEEGRLQLLTDVRRRLRDIPGADAWTKRSVLGWPADTITSAATSWNAAMIVLGIGRHGRMDRLFGTETAIAVFKHSRIPVLAVSPKARELPRHVCSAVDFTPASMSAALLAASLVAPGGTITLLHTGAFKGLKSGDGDLVELYRAGARAKLAEAVAEVRRTTRKHVEGVVVDGEPGETILKFAQQEKCDLISLGGHEQGLMDRILLGSVRTRVVRGAKCSVLIVPPRSDGA